MNYPAYSKYKNSGVNWIGNIPSEWSVTSIKYLYDVTLGKMLTSEPKSKDDTYEPYLRAANIQWDGVDTSDISKMWFSPSEKRKLSLVTGDLLVSEGGDVGRSALWEGELENCYIQNAINRVREGQNSTTKFLYYWMHFVKSTGYIDIICNKATIAHYTAEKLEATEVVFPPKDEQTQIANFLDRETAKIDTLIEKQQQLIKLLQEKRQAVISHAVTKGLNPNAKMKDSGVEWLGEVPEHWEVSKVKRLVEMAGRIGYRGYTVNDIVDEEQGAIVLSPANIDDRGFTLHKKVFLSWDKYYESPEIMLESGDILLVKTSWSFGKVSVVSEVDRPMTINPQMVLLKKSKIDPRYLSYFLNTDALQAMIFMINTGSYMPTMTQENIGDLPVLAPPVEEASTIANYIDKACKKYNALLDRQDIVIKLLKERRTALISAAVTGKIDVREAA
jgi:type I restriction enzyme S subunit